MWILYISSVCQCTNLMSTLSLAVKAQFRAAPNIPCNIFSTMLAIVNAELVKHPGRICNKLLHVSMIDCQIQCGAG